MPRGLPKRPQTRRIIAAVNFGDGRQQMLAELRQERQHVEEAIMTLERVAGRRRG